MPHVAGATFEVPFHRFVEACGEGAGRAAGAAQEFAAARRLRSAGAGPGLGRPPFCRERCAERGIEMDQVRIGFRRIDAPQANQAIEIQQSAAALVVSDAGERDGLESDGAPVARFVLEAALAVRECASRIAGLQAEFRQQDPGCGGARQLLCHPPGVLDSFFDVSLALQRGGEVVVNEGGRGVETQRLPVAAKRPREVARALAHHPEIRVRVRAFGVDRDRLAVALLRFRLAARIGEHPAQVHMQRGIYRGAIDGASEQVGGLPQVAPLARQDGEEVECLHMAGICAQDFPAQCLGPGRVAAAVMCDCSRQGAVGIHEE